VLAVGGPNYNPQGWKGPCYLITDGHYKTFDELMTQTEWDKYENKRDPRCANCMMHSGFEHTVVREVGKSWKDFLGDDAMEPRVTTEPS